jgi:hypothetical protein
MPAPSWRGFWMKPAAKWLNGGGAGENIVVSSKIATVNPGPPVTGIEPS